ncbi:MAG: ribosomal L7Ae/L30e/S12e/Gadd45 family protein [Defluviitaleaceae bacterium]|nr:ribosomal L7Ae/L30e/S12e/Gadd45 family protein [Defluviitaleaceae bacterium]
MDGKKLENMLGICKKAGALITGQFACERAVQSGKALLVLVASDASDNTKKRFSQKTFYYKIPYNEVLSMDRLVPGGNNAVCAVIDSNFSGRILELIGAGSG